MIEGRLRADAHEFRDADLDQRNAGIIVEMGDHMFGHGGIRRFEALGRTIAASWFDEQTVML
jgi:hypothetical protein